MKLSKIFLFSRVCRYFYDLVKGTTNFKVPEGCCIHAPTHSEADDLEIRFKALYGPIGNIHHGIDICQSFYEVIDLSRR